MSEFFNLTKEWQERFLDKVTKYTSKLIDNSYQIAKWQEDIRFEQSLEPGLKNHAKITGLYRKCFQRVEQIHQLSTALAELLVEPKKNIRRDDAKS